MANMTDSIPSFENTTDVFNDTSLSGNGSTNASIGNGQGGGPVFYFPWNNPENLVKQEISDDVAFGMQCVVFPILTLFGLTGNILSLIVLSRKKIRNSTTSIILIGLALSDMCFLITNMCRKSTCIISQFDELAADTWNAVSFRYIFYLRLVFSRISTLLVVFISFERFIAVAFPLKIRSLITKPRVTIAVIACYVITFVGISGIPLQYTYRYLRGTPIISPTEFALENADSLKVYNEYFLPIVFRYIPVIIVIILTIAIIVMLARSQEFKKSSAKGSDRTDEQRKVTRMLLTVAMIYLICLIPGDAVLIAADVDKKFRFFGNYHNLFLIVSDTSLLFELFNSSINFIIYMVLNKNFYTIYVSLFCRCLKRDQRSKKSNESKNKGISKEQISSDTRMTNSKATSSKNDTSSTGDIEDHAEGQVEETVQGHENKGFEE